MAKEKYKALTFINQILDTVGLLELDGFVVRMEDVKDEEGEGKVSKPLLSPGGYPYVMPRKNKLEALYGTDEDGEPVLQYWPFNIIGENIVTGKSEAITTLTNLYQSFINVAMYEVGRALIMIIKDDKNVDNVGTEIKRFIAEAAELGGKNTRYVADKTTLDLWKKLFTKVIETNPELYSTIVVKNGAKIDNTRFARVASISFPLIKEVLNADKVNNEYKVLGLTLRPKDYAVFELVFKYLVPYNDDYCVVVGSNNDKYPSFEALTKLYYSIMKPLIEKREKLDQFADPTSMLATVKFNYDIKNLETILDDINPEISNIVPEKDLIAGRTAVEVEVVADDEEVIEKVEVKRPRTSRDNTRETENRFPTRKESIADRYLNDRHNEGSRYIKSDYIDRESSSDDNLADDLNSVFGGGRYGRRGGSLRGNILIDSRPAPRRGSYSISDAYLYDEPDYRGRGYSDYGRRYRY